MKHLILLLLLFIQSNQVYGSLDSSIVKAVENQNRNEDNRKRDKYRNPTETLNFFGIHKEMKVLEIVPGRGWYTEIISSLMKGSNNFYVATYEKPSYATEIISKIQKNFFIYFKKNEEKFGEIQSVLINEDFKIMSEENYFDMVLTFRNTHNFLDQNKAKEIFNSINRSLKKGGILGVVQHRANESSQFDYKKGYVKESFLINYIEKLGFQFMEKSEINANPKDLKNYAKGVWALPPRLSDGENNIDYYKSIGESDRMTLKFKKK